MVFGPTLTPWVSSTDQGCVYCNDCSYMMFCEADRETLDRIALEHWSQTGHSVGWNANTSSPMPEKKQPRSDVILNRLHVKIVQYEEAKAKAESFGRQIRSLMNLEYSANKRVSELDEDIHRLMAELREALAKEKGNCNA